MKLSFYDWCVNNNRQDILDRWNYELNACSPDSVKYKSGKQYYFNCRCNRKHVPEKFLIEYITKGNTKMECRQCNSFYQWCVDNGRDDLIKAWNHNLNTESIYYIASGSGKKCFFSIIDDAPAILFRIADITGPKQLSPIDKFYNSLGYYLISTYGKDAVQHYWSDKNDLSPWDYDKGSGRKVWFKCIEKDYHEDYLADICHFTTGTRCPWCSGKKVHPRDSFAQYNIDRLGVDFLEKYWHKDNVIDPWTIRPFSNDQMVVIQCQHKSYHFYDTTASNFSVGLDCPLCNKKRVHPLDSFGASFPEVVSLWSDKNIKTPFDYRVTSHDKVWFKCKDNKHEDFMRRIADYSYKHFTECPKCTNERGESYFQQQVRVVLEDMPYKVLHEYNCTIVPVNTKTGYKMPFDNEVCNINGVNLIVETHGLQHYELCGWHITQAAHSGKTIKEEFEYQKWKDNFKKDYAISHGYEYLEIPYYTVTDGTYINLITLKINTILQETLETAVTSMAT